ncbi:hypothetical protein M9434_001380 [Picochlorum sp. BPE23]|nr:hypothetical protein M9434_001380 [Picochlorum sp. BPE23]
MADEGKHMASSRDVEQAVTQEEDQSSHEYVDDECKPCKGMNRRTFSVIREDRWTFKSIQWKKIIRRQDHAGLLLLVFFYVTTGIIHWTVDPRDNPFYLYDATISYPPAAKRGFGPTVPAWAAIFVPLLMGIATLVVGEFYYSKSQHHSLTDAIAVNVYFLLDLAQAVGLCMLITEATKVAVGRYRPDFLARCLPEDPGTVVLEYGNNTVGWYPCSDEYSQDTIQDGRQSFPSGHASFSMTLVEDPGKNFCQTWATWLPRYGPAACWDIHGALGARE